MTTTNTYQKRIIAGDDLVLQVNGSSYPMEAVMQIDGYKNLVVLIPGNFGMLGFAFLAIKPAGNLLKSVCTVVLVSTIRAAVRHTSVSKFKLELGKQCINKSPVQLFKKEGVYNKPIIGTLLLHFCLNHTQQEGDNIVSYSSCAVQLTQVICTELVQQRVAGHIDSCRRAVIAQRGISCRQNNKNEEMLSRGHTPQTQSMHALPSSLCLLAGSVITIKTMSVMLAMGPGLTSMPPITSNMAIRAVDG